MSPRPGEPFAIVDGRLLTDLVDVTDDTAVLDDAGRWLVVAPYEGEPILARFAREAPAPVEQPDRWVGVERSAWRSSLDEAEFRDAVDVIRTSIERGGVDQVVLTRVLRAPLPDGADIAALGAALHVGNPAPHAAVVNLPDHDIRIASASPERFLQRRGATVWSSPIKGTARTEEELLPKDRSENELITELVRDQFVAVCEPGSVTVPGRLELERHPGLVHLVSTVGGELAPTRGWSDLLDATFPPASVTGSPHEPALELIRRLEPTGRGIYCGAIGVVDADRAVGTLNVAIRTFWFEGDEIRLGTGAGITAASDPAGEWAETGLKADRLLRIATGDEVGTP